MHQPSVICPTGKPLAPWDGLSASRNQSAFRNMMGLASAFRLRSASFGGRSRSLSYRGQVTQAILQLTETQQPVGKQRRSLRRADHTNSNAYQAWWARFDQPTLRLPLAMTLSLVRPAHQISRRNPTSMTASCGILKKSGALLAMRLRNEKIAKEIGSIDDPASQRTMVSCAM
jgi:hypothetical protein